MKTIVAEILFSLSLLALPAALYAADPLAAQPQGRQADQAVTPEAGSCHFLLTAERSPSGKEPNTIRSP